MTSEIFCVLVNERYFFTQKSESLCECVFGCVFSIILCIESKSESLCECVFAVYFVYFVYLSQNDCVFDQCVFCVYTQNSCVFCVFAT